MGTEERKIQFFKNKITARLEELRDFMPEIKYKLYKTMIEDCDSYDEIREMAELDLQFNMIHYVNELKDKLKDNNTNIEELEAVTNKNVRASKLVVITPKPKSQLTNAEKLNDIDLSTLGEDMEDEDVLASAANLLLMRMRNMPPEELYREELENYEEDTSEEDIDELDGEGLFEETDEIFDDEEDELEFEDGALEDLEEELTEKKLDIRDIRTDDDDDDDDDVLDFGDKEDDEEGVDIDDLDSLGDDIFTDDIDGMDDEEDDFDIDSMDDSDLFEDTDDEFEDNNDEDFDIDSMDDSDIFVDNEDDDFDDDSEDFDIDSMDDSDMFGDSEDFEDDIDEDEGDFDIDSMDDSDMFGDDDNFEDDFEDEDGESNIDDIDDSELFDDSDSEDEFDDEFEEDNIDDIEDDSDEFDIDESDFDVGEPEDDLDDFFSDLNNNTNKSVSNSGNIQKRQMASNKIFLNNTKRGEQTQQMFNLLGGLFGGTAKLATKAGTGAKRAAVAGIQRVNNSSYFDLDSNRARR